MRDERLTLLGQTPEDLPAISALLQDATLRAEDLAFDKRGRRLVLLVNRYRWEATAPSRVRSALRIETVEAVQRQNWPRTPDAVLDLLSLTRDADHVILTFAGGPALRARTEVLEVILEDIAAPWPTRLQPKHD
ncbi:hypothetical protein GCM10011529_24910 [Polymorphobacter glacialis]|uniref:DUF2948 family protein n=1 Tax=Sandarakinorhabdus glacialis TaxID=1614636 RepID=A0A917E9J9_9SPHN|nr:DUF2948 family protein [Polymorphobacter glacialis]GGE17400.1 hypothetical protein GCM10011529_24910 [Polymorphobacter glacialis]